MNFTEKYNKIKEQLLQKESMVELNNSDCRRFHNLIISIIENDNMRIFENENGYIIERNNGNLHVFKRSGVNLDGWYESSVEHKITVYTNGYVRYEYLGKVFNENLHDYDSRLKYAKEYLGN